MAQNKMQSQAGMPLSELIERFGIEAQCDAALEGARWPSRFICPERGESGALHVSRRRAPVSGSTLVVECRRRSLWHPVPRLQAAPDQVAPGHLAVHPEQEQHLRRLSIGNGHVLVWL